MKESVSRPRFHSLRAAHLQMCRMQTHFIGRGGCSAAVALCFALAEPVTAQVGSRPPDDGVVRTPEVTVEVPSIGAPSGSTSSATDDARRGGSARLDDADLKANPNLASFILGNAVRARNWRTVRRVLTYYAEILGYDPLLALYARGALDRQDGRHGHAIAAYREMLRQDPSLTYVRLDLAAMMFEDRQLRASRALFNDLKQEAGMPPLMRGAIEQYLAAIHRQAKWNGTIRAGYKFNDNVNNASSLPYIEINSWRFEKDADSLPQHASALSYHANLNRDFNLAGNHFIAFDVTGEGDHYFTARDWRDTTATVRLGYKYRSLRSWASLTPSFSQQWLAGAPFRRTLGISAEYGRWLSRKVQVVGSYSWFQKRYEPAGYRLYDGELHVLGATAVYFANPTTVLYGGANLQRDLLAAPYESSARDGGNIGFIKAWGGGLSLRANARYSFRKFRAYSFWDQSNLRRDHEYQLDISLAHSKLGIAGIYPRLSYQLLNVDSSIPSLYSRTGNQFTLSFETSF